MDKVLKESVWRQFGAAIDMLENAMHDCPESLWGDRSREPQFWYIVFHTLFWLDFYLSEPADVFAPPEPFGLEEMDPRGVMPDRVYSKQELTAYLEHGRRKCRARISAMTPEVKSRPSVSGAVELDPIELLFHDLRHVQHHTGQLNLLLRQVTDSAPRWVRVARTPLEA